MHWGVHDPGLVGLAMHHQALVLDTGIHALGAIESDAARFVIGR